jgi:D-arabinose 1-dehydrogenase-like Zn-dependent alcohol dehydrogenase
LRSTPAARAVHVFGSSRWVIARRGPGRRDIVIDIAFVGICHSDIEHAWSLRGQPIYPLVPGDEIAGIVSATGIEVTRSPLATTPAWATWSIRVGSVRIAVPVWSRTAPAGAH